MKYFKKLSIFIIALLLLLLAARLCLPYILLHYVEKQINKIPEYRVKIANLDMHLYRGSYSLHQLQLWKMTKNIPVPYLSSDVIDFSIQWRALFKGKLVAKIVTDKSVLNLVTGSHNNEQITISSQWIDIVKSLFPLNINRFEARDSAIHFRSYSGKPPFNIYIDNLNVVIENMQNVTRDQKLLSSNFHVAGTPMGGGNVVVDGKFNPFTKLPTFDLNAKLTSLSIRQLANFLKHYTSIDVAGGTFNLYGEAAAANGKITGYAKPFIKNLKIGSTKDKSPISPLVNGIATVAAKILENPKQKTIATKIKISGSVDNPDTRILSIIGYLLRHAFINALIPEIDNTVDIQNVYYGNQRAVSKPTKGKHYSTYTH